jgi:hypothetical protein
MFEHDDVLIVGDSFAQMRNKESDWPQLLCKLLTGSDAIPRGRGFSGASWWSTRKNLLTEFAIKIPKVLVICHTEAARIPSDYDFGLNVASTTSRDIDLPLESKQHYVPKIRDAAAMYYTYLTSIEYNNWAQLAWYFELEQLLIQYNIPQVIHLHCFPPAHGQTSLYCFKVGCTEQVTLWDLCKDVSQNGARNHFTAEQNIRIAHAINNTLVAHSHEAGWVDMKLLG